MISKTSVVELPHPIGSECELDAFLSESSSKLASNHDFTAENFHALTHGEHGCIIWFTQIVEVADETTGRPPKFGKSFVARFHHSACTPAFGERHLPKGQKLLVFGKNDN